MAFIIGIMGESGSGKTTSCRTLPPTETLYIDCDGKGLSWKGWRTQYNKENKNYLKTSDKDTVSKAIRKVSSDPNMANIKYIVIDTINGIMVDDEFARMGEKNYDKWADLAAAVYNIIKEALEARDDLTVIFLAHSQTERDDTGVAWTHIKTSGKKLDKIVLESKFPCVLYAKCVNGKHFFETHANCSTAKTPYGSYDELEIENDILAVIKNLEDYR